MFNPVAVRSVNETLPYLLGGDPGPSVIELGNQRFSPGNASYPKGVTTTEDFYRACGFSRYVAIDVNDRMSAIAMDLNLNLWEAYGYTTQYDLVTNNGTGEHIFDQRMVFENVHNLCKPGGIMLHILPMVGWINHGFYNYNPFLFRDLAEANDYEIHFIWLSKRDDKPVVLTSKPYIFQEKRPVELRKVIQSLGGFSGANIFLAVALRKAKAPARGEIFRVPIQGKYQGDITSDEIGARYGTK